LDEPKAERRAGLVGTVVVHVVLGLVLWSLPEDLLDKDAGALAQEESRAFEIELAPEWFEEVAPTELAPPRFVEVNPAAPENPPDETPFIGSQNQQVAQPEPTPAGESDTPMVEGDGEPNATAIVKGDQTEPQAPAASEILEQLFTPPAPPSIVPEREERATAEQSPERAINAPGGGEQLLGDADNAPGTTVTSLPPTPGAETGAEARAGAADGRRTGGGYFAGTPAIDRNRPMDRTRLSAATVNARNAPTIRNDFGTQNIGAVAYNARWSEYGEYLQRLIDAVQAQWDRILMRSSYYPPGGSLVKVVFKLNDRGEVFEIVKVEGEGGEVAKRLCVSAITERAPFGEWPQDMRTALGTEQELTFRFFYR
jgi:hypothetical protein